VTDEQLELVRTPAKRKSRARVKTPASSAPIARVVADVALPQLDRVFDYLVPAHLDAAAVPGGRVRVRLAGRLVDGYLLARVDSTDHEGRLGYLERAHPEVVLTSEVARLARAVAERQGGTYADVLRLAVPPRHAAAEAEPSEGSPQRIEQWSPGPWTDYTGGASFLGALAEGRAPRAVWNALPGPRWPADIAGLVAATLASGRGVVVVVPDARDVRRVGSALDAVLPARSWLALTAELGPAERYRRFLAIARGKVRVAVGSRSAVFAPVSDLGLVVVWDDGDETLAEPRAPYPHARDVAVLRAHLAGAGLVLGGLARTAEAQSLVMTGWAQELVAARDVVRARTPALSAIGDDDELARDPGAQSARLPTRMWRALRDGLASGHPVLVQVPRRGYVPSVACAQCRARARCAHCAGPLELASSHAVAACRWCGRPAGGWRCPDCAGERLRASVVGTARTAEEIGRAFPGVSVRTSGGSAVIDEVPDRPAIVVSTPGAEPVAEDGYAAVVLLDGWQLLGRADLRATEETLRRWFGAAALARSRDAGGRVVVGAAGSVAAVQALLRWDPAGAAERELAERIELGFPPATRLAAVTGSAGDLTDFLQHAELPATADTLGPVPIGDDETQRVLVRTPRNDGAALATALATAVTSGAARRAGNSVRIRLDPLGVV
jgi:primosomal protein N' (replication factor Y) (superfamily II helicase)